jgi:hypothetical protein
MAHWSAPAVYSPPSGFHRHSNYNQHHLGDRHPKLLSMEATSPLTRMVQTSTIWSISQMVAPAWSPSPTSAPSVPVWSPPRKLPDSLPTRSAWRRLRPWAKIRLGGSDAMNLRHKNGSICPVRRNCRHPVLDLSTRSRVERSSSRAKCSPLMVPASQPATMPSPMLTQPVQDSRELSRLELLPKLKGVVVRLYVIRQERLDLSRAFQKVKA